MRVFGTIRLIRAEPAAISRPVAACGKDYVGASIPDPHEEALRRASNGSEGEDVWR